MGELYRKHQEAFNRRNAPWRKKPASEAQRDLLRRLCEEQDGEVDEAWLQVLTAGGASDEIDRRRGEDGA